MMRTNSEIIKIWLDHGTPETVERMRDFMHAEHKFHNPLTPEPLDSEAHIMMLHNMQTTFSNQVHHIDLLLESDNYITVRGRLTGVHSGEFMGMQATNKLFKVNFTLIAEFIDGKIRNEYMELNPLSIKSQLSM